MTKIANLKTRSKILVIAAMGILIVTALLFATQRSSGEDLLSEAVEGGELALRSVGRNRESLAQFVQNHEAQARQLLETARMALESAEEKLGSAGRTSDEYVLGMVDNYQLVAGASSVMAQGVDNLLFIGENLRDALDYYSQEDFEKASEQAFYCLQVLTPLLSDFEASKTALEDINLFYIPSGQRDQLTLRVNQYAEAVETYNQYVLLLESLLRGKEYLQKNALLEDYLRQLQNAIANEDYERAQALLQEISELLKSLRDAKYQSAAELASKLEPNLLEGMTSDIAQELLNKLRDLERIDAFENYLKSLEKYLEALRHLEKGELEEAQQAANKGLGILGQEQGGDPELQALYVGLREALNSLQQSIKGQPPEG